MALPKLTEAQKLAHLEKIIPLYQHYRAKVKTPLLVSILLAQNLHEGYYGASDLYKQYNNVAGMKYKDPWTGRKINYASGEEINGKWVEGVKSDFIWFDSIEQSIEYHANFCQNTDWRKTTYEKALEATTYVGQAAGLTGTYATDSKYGPKLIEIIEKYDLTKYDKEDNKMSVKFPKPKMVDRTKSALGYPGHGFYHKRTSLTQIKEIITHYTDSLGKFITAHEDWWKNGNKWDIGGYTWWIATDGTIYQNYDMYTVTYGSGGIGSPTLLNPPRIHICLEGNSVASYTAAQLKSKDALILWLLSDPLKHLNGNNVKGHKEVPYNNTSCPGYSIAQLSAYRAELNQKLKAGSVAVNPNNPQGMGESTPLPYVAPRLPFDTLKVGQKATLLDEKNAQGKLIWQWYDVKNNKLLLSPRQVELAGTTDEIAEVITLDTKIQHSEIAYKLKNYNSVILEEYVKEARNSWVVIDENLEDDVVDVHENFVQLNGKRYVVGDEIK